MSRIVIVLVVLMSVVGYAGYYTYKEDGLTFRSNIKQLNDINAEFVGALWKYTKNDICQTQHPLKGTDKYGWWFCMANNEDKPTLLLLGNSYVNHFYPGIINNPELKHHSVLSIGTCDAGWVEKSELSGEITFQPCSGYRSLDQLELINKIITTEKSIRYVIIGGLSKIRTYSTLKN